MPEDRTQPESFRTGFVAIVGRPNVGKSTLLNRLLGEKVAIVSEKPQTTRNLIRGILTRDDFQVVFIDTPGIHQARDEINRYMVRQAVSTFQAVDLVLFLVEPSIAVGKDDEALGRRLKEVDAPVLLVINKIDRLGLTGRQAALRACMRAFPGMRVFPVSALKGEGVEGLLAQVVSLLPEGEMRFPPDEFTDQPVRFLCAELIRERVFHLTGEEVPYSVAVEVVSFQESERDSKALVHVEANLHVERPSQKGILIGSGGQMLKRIGTEARMRMESLLGAKVMLKLWVKVTRGWKNDPKSLRWLGYR